MLTLYVPSPLVDVDGGAPLYSIIGGADAGKVPAVLLFAAIQN